MICVIDDNKKINTGKKKEKKTKAKKHYELFLSTQRSILKNVPHYQEAKKITIIQAVFSNIN